MAEVPQVTAPSADALYQPGISFRNAKLVRTVTSPRSEPWFYSDQVPGPLSVSSKLKRWDKTSSLNRYKAVWNRKAKQRVAEKLGAYFHDVPSLQELGEAPAATKETTATSRGPLGFLENLISAGAQVATGVTDIIANRELQKQQTAMAQYQASRPMFFGSGSDNTMLWVLGIGAIGIGAVVLLKRRK
jgi:hypothetical protein